MKSRLQTDTSLIVPYIKARLDQMYTWPHFKGHPGDIEAAIIDAVFSTRYVYSTPNEKGLQPLLRTWIVQRRRRSGPSARALIREIEWHGGGAQWASVHFTRHKIAGWPKGDIVYEAAALLSWQGINRAVYIGELNLTYVMDILQTVDGIGLPTARYAAMLLGFPEVKPDIWVKGFVGAAVGRTVTYIQTIAIVKAAAHALDIPNVSMLEHAIWTFQRRQRLIRTRAH